MPALQVKDCPQSVYDQLRSCADASNRSMAQQALHILETFLELYDTAQNKRCPDSEIFRLHDTDPYAHEKAIRTAQIERRHDLFDRIATRDPLSIPDEFPDVVDIIHEMRDERGADTLPELKGSA